jgi:hypothetical protein
LNVTLSHLPRKRLFCRHGKQNPTGALSRRAMQAGRGVPHFCHIDLAGLLLPKRQIF